MEFHDVFLPFSLTSSLIHKGEKMEILFHFKLHLFRGDEKCSAGDFVCWVHFEPEYHFYFRLKRKGETFLGNLISFCVCRSSNVYWFSFTEISWLIIDIVTIRKTASTFYICELWLVHNYTHHIQVTRLRAQISPWNFFFPLSNSLTYSLFNFSCCFFFNENNFLKVQQFTAHQ